MNKLNNKTALTKTSNIAFFFIYLYLALEIQIQSFEIIFQTLI